MSPIVAERSKRKVERNLLDLKESDEELFNPPHTQTFLTEVWKSAKKKEIQKDG